MSPQSRPSHNGFARRFATYKRGDLIFDDPDRLEAILDKVATRLRWKAHPANIAGQKVLANVLKFARGQDLLTDVFANNAHSVA